MIQRFIAMLLLTFFMAGVFGQPTSFAGDLFQPKISGISAGMTKSQLFRRYPKKEARTYREEGADEWITFNYPLRCKDCEMITFYIQDGRVKEWRLNDRAEVVKEYIGEFCSGGITHGLPQIHAAIKDVLERLSLKDFLNVTNRQRPVLITEFYDSGTARFANTSEIIASPQDAPAFAEGVTIIKLSSGLNEAPDPAPIKGVLAHELAHRVLEHARKRVSCNEEREANRLIKEWGFAEEFRQASQMFGRKAGDPSSCQKE